MSFFRGVFWGLVLTAAGWAGAGAAVHGLARLSGPPSLLACRDHAGGGCARTWAEARARFVGLREARR